MAAVSSSENLSTPLRLADGLTGVKMIYLAPHRVPPRGHRASIRLERESPVAAHAPRSRHLLRRPRPGARAFRLGPVAERRCLPESRLRIGGGSSPRQAPQVSLQRVW